MSAKEVRRRRWQAKSGLRPARLVEVSAYWSATYTRGDVEHARQQGIDEGLQKCAKTVDFLSAALSEATGSNVINRTMRVVDDPDDLTSLADSVGVIPDDDNLNRTATVVDLARWRQARR